MRCGQTKRVSAFFPAAALGLLAALSLAPLAMGEEPAAADAAAVAARIEQFLQGHWQANNITPAAPAADATFLRRVTLDLAGRLPAADQIRAFAADRSQDKRARLVAALIAGPEFPLHLGNVL